MLSPNVDDRRPMRKPPNKPVIVSMETLVDNNAHTELELQREEARKLAKEKAEYLKEQEERLAEEILKQRADQCRKELEIQHICESSEELAKLENAIRIAYVNKERAAQLQEARLFQAMEEDREYLTQYEMDRQLRAAELEDQMREAEKIQRSLEHKQVIHLQIEEKEVRLSKYILLNPHGFYRSEIVTSIFLM